MADPFLILGRLLMLVFVPAMLLFPLAYATLVPNRAKVGSTRLQVRGRWLSLALCTLFLLTIWVGLLLTGLRFPGVLVVANFWFCWFFPLWFFLAMPLVADKQSPKTCSVSSGENGSQADGVRSAMLVNRERLSPVTRSMWAIPIAIFTLALGAIAARGVMPFPMTDHGSEEAAFAASERFQWLLALGCYGGGIGAILVLLPYGLRRSLAEPEPMNATGSCELVELYVRQRRLRVLGLFWTVGTVLPLVIGLFIALPLWLPSFGSMWGLAGSLVGSMIVIMGAIVSTWLIVERVRIAETRSRLNTHLP